LFYDEQDTYYFNNDLYTAKNYLFVESILYKFLTNFRRYRLKHNIIAYVQ